ncbi:MAG: LppX_LprAFG lipoprotein [Ardenticatenaceae bacterium]|nr:LppX_LprAFG lipoprotein [Ardenticatenaceae bacterium]
MQRRLTFASRWIVLILLLALAACQTDTNEAATAVPATDMPATAVPVIAAADTETPVPTETATAIPPTETPPPTETAVPTEIPPTATRSKPTATPTRAKETATATAVPDSNSDATPDAAAPDALELLTRSSEAQGKLDSFTQIQTISMESDLFTQTQTQTCMYDMPDQIYCYNETAVIYGSETVTGTTEMVYNGEAFWMRQNEGEWEQMPEDFMQQMGYSEDLTAQSRLVLDESLITAATITGETVIDGVPVYQIEAEMDLSAMLEIMLNEEMAAQFADMVEDGTLTTTLWIGQEDNLTRKQLVNMSFTVEGMELTMSMQAANTGFNEPVDIPDPTAGN